MGLTDSQKESPNIKRLFCKSKTAYESFYRVMIIYAETSYGSVVGSFG